MTTSAIVLQHVSIYTPNLKLSGNLPAKAGHAEGLGSVPGSERSPGRGTGNPRQYSCLEIPMDRGAWWAIVHGVAKGGTQQSNWVRTFNLSSVSVRFIYFLN